jgi:RNA polymerase sigma-70 factor (ECF subfamily)
VIDIEAYANLQELEVEDPAPTPEQVVMARAELRWLLGLVANLPERCGRVFSARKIYGLSQSETAESMGITENVVEKEMMKAWKMVSDMISRVGVDGAVNEGEPQAVLAHARKVKWRS